MFQYPQRWAVQGRKPNGDNATTTFDMLPNQQQVVVCLATADIYTVTITAPAVRMLAATAGSGTACAVPAEHATHGRRLLGLHPYPSTHEASWLNHPADALLHPGPMELYLVLPDDEIHIIYGQDQFRLLADTLAEIIESFI